MGEVNLSDGEWKIMNILWESAPCTITQITNELKDDTHWTKHTIITMLGRLEKKAAIHYKEGGRAKQFYPSVQREEITAEETDGFLKKVYQGSLSLLVNAMVEQKSLTKREIDELYDILRKAEKGE